MLRSGPNRNTWQWRHAPNRQAMPGPRTHQRWSLASKHQMGKLFPVGWRKVGWGVGGSILDCIKSRSIHIHSDRKNLFHCQISITLESRVHTRQICVRSCDFKVVLDLCGRSGSSNELFHLWDREANSLKYSSRLASSSSTLKSTN